MAKRAIWEISFPKSSETNHIVEFATKAAMHSTNKIGKKVPPWTNKSIGIGQHSLKVENEVNMIIL